MIRLLKQIVIRVQYYRLRREAERIRREREEMEYIAAMIRASRQLQSTLERLRPPVN